MIGWISQWLREIIIVVMLAVFVDLLLPSQALKRYVRVVLSLFILIAIISPLASLFKANLDFASWEGEVIEAQGFQSLHAVLETGAAIRENNERQALQYIEASLAEQMKRELDLALPGEINSVKVAAASEDGELMIKEVHVGLYATAISERRRQDDQSELLDTVRQGQDDQLELLDTVRQGQDDQLGLLDIEPIETVVINIELNHINEEHVLTDREALAASVTPEVTGANEASLTAISHILMHNWHVSSKQLVFSYVDEVSSLYEQEVGMWASCCKSLNNG